MFEEEKNKSEELLGEKGSAKTIFPFIKSFKAKIP